MKLLLKIKSISIKRISGAAYLFNSIRAMSSDQYSNQAAASKFQMFKEIFERKQYAPVDTPSIMSHLGDLASKEVIDYGCGSGFYTRKIAEKAKRVVGVDLSQPMIGVAEKVNKELGIENIEYHVVDCQKMLDYGLFDVAFSSYFLIYAQNEDMFRNFVSSMYGSLKSGGVCCGVTNNYDLNKSAFEKLHKYGYEIIAKDEPKDGDLHVRRFYADDVKNSECLFEARSFHMSLATVEKVFRQCGFRNFKWSFFTLSDSYAHLKQHFEDYFKYPPAAMYSAIKE